MSIKVHGMALSSCTVRVLLCLHEKGVDYELGPVDALNHAHRQQPYLSLNPFGQMPAFERRPFNTLWYLAYKYEETGTDLLRSNCLKESAIVETWMEVEARQFHAPIRTIFRQLIFNPLTGLLPDEKIVEDEMGKLGEVLDVYEERLVKSKYLAGVYYYTMADLHHLPYYVSRG